MQKTALKLVSKSKLNMCTMHTHNFYYIGQLEVLTALKATSEQQRLRPLQNFIPAFNYSGWSEFIDRAMKKPELILDIDKVDIPDCWFKPEEGIKTLHALEDEYTANPISDNMTDIQHFILQDIRTLAALLAIAQHREDKFFLTAVETEETPDTLERWKRKEYAELAEYMMELINNNKEN